jgi:hypothetical protein
MASADARGERFHSMDIALSDLVHGASETARGRSLSGVWLAAESRIEASVYGKHAPFQGAFPATQRKALAVTDGSRLNLEMIHDHISCEQA